MPKVGVVIVTYNNKDMLDPLLAQVHGQTVPPDEIIVIDNASSDNTASMLREKYPRVLPVRMESNSGSAGGYYEGIKRACVNNDLIWLLDDDVAVNQDALGELVRWLNILERFGKVGAVRSWGRYQVPGPLPVKAASFAWRGTLIRKDVVGRIGLPRQDYFLYGDDAEYALRMTREGYAIFWIPASIVVEKRTSTRECLTFAGMSMETYRDPVRLYYAFRNQVHQYSRHRRGWLLFTTFAYALKLSCAILWCPGARHRGKPSAILEGICDGLRGKLGRDGRYLPGEQVQHGRLWYPLVRARDICRRDGAAGLIRKIVVYPLQIMYALYYAAVIRKVSGQADERELVNLVFRGFHGLIKPFQVEQELHDLLAQVRRIRPSCVLEIGTATGGTLFCFSRLAAANARIISIDLPAGRFGGGYPFWRIPLYTAFASGRQAVHLVRGDSHDPAVLRKVTDILAGDQLELLYIDADHSYEGVKNDFRMYMPLVKEGGMIVLHDIVPHPSGTGCRVDRFWAEVKTSYRHREIVKDPRQGIGGIGIVFAGKEAA